MTSQFPQQTRFFRSPLAGRILAGLAVLSIMPLPAWAQFATYSAYSDFTVEFANETGSETAEFDYIDGAFNGNGDPVSFSDSYFFQDVYDDYAESELDMTFSTQGSASAIAGQLRTNVSGSVINPAYSDTNDPYVTEFGTDEFGVPSIFNATATASFTDRLQYGGTATAYTSKYLIRLTGNISGEDAFHQVFIQHGSEPAQEFFFFSNGPIDELLVSDTYVHGGAPQFFTMTMTSYYQVDTSYSSGYEMVSGAADFGNTLELVGVELRNDDTGELLPEGSIVSDSGFEYSIVVPEPTSAIAMVGIAIMGLLRPRRR
jgi:hypothetical protein